MNNTRRILMVATLLAAGALISAGAVAQEVKVPETAADHEALAKTYEEKVAAYKKEADWHRQMAQAYARKFPELKTGQKHPWTAKMEKHCEAMSKTADKLAAEAQKAADFHKLRAKEMQGK